MNLGLKIGANIDGVYVSGGVSGGGCDAMLKEFGGESKSRFKFVDSTKNKQKSHFGMRCILYYFYLLML